MEKDRYQSLPYCRDLNHEILRSRALTAQLKEKHAQAHELFHALRNLLTVRCLLLDAIRQSSRQARRIRSRLRCTRPISSAMRPNRVRRHMSILQALAILEAAMPLGREKQNISTSAISAALSILERQIEPPSLIPQFLCHLRNAAEEVVDKETQQRALRTTFLQIRAAVGQVLRTKRDLLARKFHYTRNPLIKQEIDHLGRELVKLDALWGTSKK